MKIYNVVRSSVYGGSDSVSIIKTFNSISPAIDFLKERFEIELKDIKATGIDESSIVVEQSEMNASIYKDGFYADDHIDLCIIESSVEINGYEYWATIAKEYADKIDEEKAYEVAEMIMNDDYLWETIDTCLQEYVDECLNEED